MTDWLLELVLLVLAIAVFGGLLYSLVFAPSRRGADGRRTVFTGYDRREPERADRRKRDLPPPTEVGDRRQGPRRTDE